MKFKTLIHIRVTTHIYRKYDLLYAWEKAVNIFAIVLTDIRTKTINSYSEVGGQYGSLYGHFQLKPTLNSIPIYTYIRILIRKFISYIYIYL